MLDAEKRLAAIACGHCPEEEHFALFVNGGYPDGFQTVAGFGCMDAVEVNRAEDLSALDHFVEKHKGRWIFAHFTYDLKDLLEPRLNSREEDVFHYPAAALFVPNQLLIVEDNEVVLMDQSSGKKTALSSATLPPYPESNGLKAQGSEMQDAGMKSSYMQAVHKVMNHLKRGDIYELNYCLPFSNSGRLPDPAATWWGMQQRQQAPFACLYRHRHNWLLCCSPERYLKKAGNRVLSQPMKGTIRRGRTDREDELLKQELLGSEKERAENVMIVDLVRNDLGRVALTGSVRVDELFGVYPFPNVHQMISTVSAEIPPGLPLSALLKATFPMGSMTGAPKIRAMEIIEETELFRRGLYSGSTGYITPEGDFDFNVVIRSILYDSKHECIRYPAGSAITAGCDPEKEWEECLLKAAGMRSVI